MFTRIGEEDLDFASDIESDFEIPEFGDSTSDYEEVILSNKNNRTKITHWFAGCKTILCVLAIILHFSTLLMVRQVYCRYAERSSKKNSAVNGKR